MIARRRAALVAVLCLLGANPSGAPQEALRPLVGVTFTAHVLSVIDGDTIDVGRSGGPTRMRVRLEGIDAPEAGEPFSQAARSKTRVLAFDRDVRVEGRDVDRYGRLVARVVVEDGATSTDLSVALAADGLACHFRQYSSDPALARAEAGARAAGRGFWARGAQKPACVARNVGAAQATAKPASPAASKPSGAVAQPR